MGKDKMSYKKALILALFFYALFLLIILISMIGTVSGERVWTVYSYPFTSDIFLSSDGRNPIICYTEFKKKDNYFISPNGLVIKNKDILLASIQKKINQGQYACDGCQ